MDGQNQFNSIEELTNLTNNGDRIGNLAISDDGRYVALESESENNTDILVFDRNEESTRSLLELLDVESDSSIPSSLFDPVISGDGQYLGFSSASSNLVSDDNNENRDAFVFDLNNQTVERISLSIDGAEVELASSSVESISDDGKYITFSSTVNNLVANDNNGSLRDVFLFDRLNSTIELISPSEASLEYGNSSISGDGRYIAYETRLASADGSGEVENISIFDRQENNTQIIDLNSDLAANPDLSDDGRYVVFESASSDLVADDDNGIKDIFVRDLLEQTTEIITADGALAKGPSNNPAIDDSGRYIVFKSEADNLVSDDTNGESDLFIYDRESDFIELLSIDGDRSSDFDGEFAFSGNGQNIVFSLNGEDIFVRSNTTQTDPQDKNDSDDVDDNLDNDNNTGKDDSSDSQNDGNSEEIEGFTTDRVHRFFERNNGSHLYTIDDNEISYIRQQSALGNLAYQDEAERFTVLSENTDSLTGEVIPGVVPVYRFFNTDTGAHLYTTDENEKNTIQDTLDNYSFEGIKYYAFESQPENLDTIPVFRMLNGISESHLFSVDFNEIQTIQETLPHYSFENNGEPVFYVF